MKWGLFHKHFVKSSKKKHTPHRKISEFFLLDTLKTTFWMVNLRMGISGPFPPKSGHFSLFLKRVLVTDHISLSYRLYFWRYWATSVSQLLAFQVVTPQILKITLSFWSSRSRPDKLLSDLRVHLWKRFLKSSK